MKKVLDNRGRVLTLVAASLIAALPVLATETNDVQPQAEAQDVVAQPEASDIATLTDTFDAGQGQFQAGAGLRSRGASVSTEPAGLGGPTVNVAGCGTTIVGSLGTCTGPNCFSATQTGRVFRNAVASACSPGKACPGASAGGPFIYDAYTFDNTTPNAVCNCITVTLDVGTCGAGVHATAFAGTYSPTAAWACTGSGYGYLGDVGSSISQPFSFELPPGTTTWSLVFNQNFTTTPRGCSYTAKISCGSTPSLSCALLPIEAKLDALPCEVLKLVKPPKPAKDASSASPCN